MSEQVTPPLCIFDGVPELAEHAQRFIDATVARPQIMQQALTNVRVTNTGEFMFGVPGERDSDVDTALSDCIGAMALLLRSGADRYFSYDKDTRKVMSADPILRQRWAEKRDAQTGYDEMAAAARVRVARLAVYAGRLADPHDINAQLRVTEQHVA